MPWWLSALICLVVIGGLFAVFAVPMGLSNMFSTLMNTAFELLINLLLYNGDSGAHGRPFRTVH